MLLSDSKITELRFSDFSLDRSRRRLTRQQDVVALPAKAFDLLVFFVENPGRPLSKDEIMRSVWPDSIVEESNLSQNVFLLRKALRVGGEDLIITLPGRGYQFAARVENVLPVTPEKSPAPSITTLEATHSHVIVQEESEERIAIWRSSEGRLILIGCLLLCTVAGWLGWQRWEDRIGGPPLQLVLADFDGSTGDTNVDQALLAGMRIDLSQSPFVTVVPAATVSQTLTQMMHKPDEKLTQALARDLCERTGSQAVLHGVLAHVGSTYLVTGEATNCIDGTLLASAKIEAKQGDDLPGAIDSLTATLRRRLGESRRTISRFSTPLLPVNTGSLEALEAYSQATNLSVRGKLPEAIGLLNHAVALDPQFAAAYLNLSNFYAGVGDKQHEREYIGKAYALRSTANEPAQLYIVARYNSVITGDLYASLRNYLTWTEIYPRQPAAWIGLADVYRQLGQYADAASAAKHALTLRHDVLSIYYVLSLMQIYTAEIDAARTTIAAASAHGLDNELMHNNLMTIAILQHDPGLQAEQIAWAESHAGASHLILKEAQIALTEGRLADSRKLIDRASEGLKQQGLTTLATQYTQQMSRFFADLSDVAGAREMLHLGPVDPEVGDELISLAETGDPQKALDLLRQEIERQPQATLLTRITAPQVRAVAALAAHRPNDAITALEPSRGLEAVALEPLYLRGVAYLDVGKLREAESQFRAVLADPQIDAASPMLSLAKLGLARALARDGDRDQAAKLYQEFLAQWAHANGDQTLFDKAKVEASLL